MSLGVGMSVRLFVILSGLRMVCNLKFWFSYNNQTWTVSSYRGCAHLLTSHASGRGAVSDWRIYKISSHLVHWCLKWIWSQIIYDDQIFKLISFLLQNRMHVKTETAIWKRRYKTVSIEVGWFWLTLFFSKSSAM